MWEPEGRHTLASPPARRSSHVPPVKLTCVRRLRSFPHGGKLLPFKSGTTSSTTVGEAAQDTMMPSLSVGKFRRQVVVATFEYFEASVLMRTLV